MDGTGRYFDARAVPWIPLSVRWGALRKLIPPLLNSRSEKPPDQTSPLAGVLDAGLSAGPTFPDVRITMAMEDGQHFYLIVLDAKRNHVEKPFQHQLPHFTLDFGELFRVASHAVGRR